MGGYTWVISLAYASMAAAGAFSAYALLTHAFSGGWRAPGAEAHRDRKLAGQKLPPVRRRREKE